MRTTHRRLASWMALLALCIGLAACEEREEQLSPATQDRLNTIIQSLGEVETSVTRIESQYQAVRQEQQTTANNLDALRIQAETLDGNLGTMESATASSRLEIEKLKQKVNALRDELSLVASGKVAAPPEAVNHKLEVALAIIGGVLLIAAIVGSLFYMFHQRNKRNRRSVPSYVPPSEMVPLEEEVPTEQRTEIGAIRFYGAAKTEHEKQQGVTVKPPEESASDSRNDVPQD